MVVEVQRWVDGFAEAHLVPLSLLVVLAEVGEEGGAVLVLEEAFEEVLVEHEVAGGVVRGLAGAHTTHSEGERDEFVVELGKVVGLRAEEADDHVAGHLQLVLVLGSKVPAEATSKARVSEGACNWGGQSRLAVPGEDGVHDCLECSLGSAHGGKNPQHGLESVRAQGEDLVE